MLVLRGGGAVAVSDLAGQALAAVGQVDAGSWVQPLVAELAGRCVILGDPLVVCGLVAHGLCLSGVSSSVASASSQQRCMRWKQRLAASWSLAASASRPQWACRQHCSIRAAWRGVCCAHTASSLLAAGRLQPLDVAERDRVGLGDVDLDAAAPAGGGVALASLAPDAEAVAIAPGGRASLLAPAVVHWVLLLRAMGAGIAC